MILQEVVFVRKSYVMYVANYQMYCNRYIDLYVSRVKFLIIPGQL